jgi:hypothetical protein
LPRFTERGTLLRNKLKKEKKHKKILQDEKDEKLTFGMTRCFFGLGLKKKRIMCGENKCLEI